MKKQHHHLFAVAFPVISPNACTSDDDYVTAEELLTGLEQRLTHLRHAGGEILEACGAPEDTYEIDHDHVTCRLDLPDTVVNVLAALRSAGYAVAILPPSEIGDAEPGYIESVMLERASACLGEPA